MTPRTEPFPGKRNANEKRSNHERIGWLRSDRLRRFRVNWWVDGRIDWRINRGLKRGFGRIVEGVKHRRATKEIKGPPSMQSRRTARCQFADNRPVHHAKLVATLERAGRGPKLTEIDQPVAAPLLGVREPDNVCGRPV
jgi:hypothetical protein